MKSYSPTAYKGREKFEKQWGDVSVFGATDLETCREKPWQRVPSYWSIPFLGALLLFAYLIHLSNYAMPSPLSDSEAGWQHFSEERAWSYLRRVVGDGPRVAGSRYHRQKTEEMKSMVDEIAASANQIVYTDWQIVSGDFYLSHRSSYINSYRRASNVVAMLVGDAGVNGSSVLFNCHYDSVPTAPGASDNAIFCAVLLETLSVMSKSENRLKHNVIFLFNGAEESSLQASHGFLSHDWSRNVTALVNLDSTGMNGKAVLFQVTDPRVLSAYKSSVNIPSAHAIGEALFTSGAVPSDTDFRVFRDFGNIYGIDIAFSRYGQVYHTRFDSLELVRPGVLQHSGDMIHSVAKTLAGSQLFGEKAESTSSAVYFDYAYLFMVSYSHAAAHSFDAFVVLIGFASAVYYLWTVGLRWRNIKSLLVTMLVFVAAILCGCLTVAALTVIMVKTMPQLRYYSNAWLVVPMYWMPFLLVAGVVVHRCDWLRAEKSGLNRSARVSESMAASRSLCALVLLCLTCVPATVSMRYAVTVPLLITSLAGAVSLTLRQRWMVSAWEHLLLEVGLSLFCLPFVLTLTLSLNALMLPVMGRSVTHTPDYYVAAVNVVMATLTVMPLAGVETLFSRRRLWLSAALAGSLSVVLMFLPLAVYNADSAPAPQRYYIFNVQRTTYNVSGDIVSQSSGLWAGHTDVHSPRTFVANSRVSETALKTNFTDDCRDYLYCDLPMLTPRTADLVPFSVWAEFPPPATFSPAPGVRLTNRECALNACTLYFNMTGTAYNSMAIWPRADVNLTAWSLDSDLVNVSSKHGRPVFFVWHTFCTYEDVLPDFEFWITVQFPEDSDGLTSGLIDLSFNAHKTHHPEEMTSEFASVINSLPDWINPVPYMTARFNYVF